MFGAIDVPCVDGEEECAVWFGGVVGVGDFLEELGVIFDESGGSPEFDAASVGVVHEEDEGFGVFGEVAECDVLFVACVVRDGDGVIVDDFDEAWRATAVLHVGLAVCGGGGDVDGVALCDEIL